MEDEHAKDEPGRDDSDKEGVDYKKGVDEEGVQGAKQVDNPERGKGTGEGKGGLGSQTGALGGGKPVEPGRTSGG